MIELRDVWFGYTDTPDVLTGVDLAVDDGELVLVAGRTGSGKSTLLGLFNGLVPDFTGGRLRGDVVVDGASVLGVPPRERAHVVGYVGQDPAAGFVTDTAEEELVFGMEQLGLPPATMRRRVEETLDLLGIAELRGRDLRTLSGGQQQRVAVGAVLTTHPRMLVLDEPTSALDPTAAEEVLATLTRLVHDVGLSVLVAEHRLERVVPFVDRMCVLDGAGGVQVGEARTLLRTSPVAPPIVELGRLAGWDPLPLSVREARRVASPLRDRLGARLGPGPTAGRRSGPDVLTAARISVGYGRRVAVRAVDLALQAGTVTALMGRNGSGKSSLLSTLQGSGRRTSGRVDVLGADPAELSPRQRRSRVGLVPQTAADLLFLETVEEECHAADRDTGATEGRCAQILDDLVPRVPRAAHPRDLSEGQRLALVLAIVLTSAPQVIALDEPTRGLDYPAKRALSRILAAQAEQGRAVLVATHDVEFVAHVADRVVVMAEGEVVSAGPARRVIAESPAFSPQVSKVLGPQWLTVADVAASA